MIFGDDERAFLEKVLRSVPDSLPTAKMISGDIALCRLMLDISRDIFSALPAGFAALNYSETEIAGIRSRYEAFLSPSDYADETEFQVFCGILRSWMPDFAAAFCDAFLIVSGKDLLTYADIRMLSSFRESIARLKKTIPDSDGQDAREAASFADGCIRKCGIALRIQSGKYVPEEEIFSAVECDASAGKNAFLGFCAGLMDEKDRSLWDSFFSEENMIRQICLSRAICDAIYGSPGTER